MLAIADASADTLCLPRPSLDFDFTIQAKGDTSVLGDKELATSVYQQVLLTYHVRNIGLDPIRNVKVVRGGQTVLTAHELAPGLGAVSTETLVPSVPENLTLAATVTATDEGGNALPGTPRDEHGAAIGAREQAGVRDSAVRRLAARRPGPSLLALPRAPGQSRSRPTDRRYRDRR